MVICDFIHQPLGIDIKSWICVTKPAFIKLRIKTCNSLKLLSDVLFLLALLFDVVLSLDQYVLEEPEAVSLPMLEHCLLLHRVHLKIPYGLEVLWLWLE